jgi:arginase family enzyme
MVNGGKMSQTVKVIGSSLDPLDGWEKVEIKRAYLGALSRGIKLTPNYLDPYDAVTSLSPDLFEGRCKKAGKVPVPTWLTPKPSCGDLPLITSESYRKFLEGNECYRYSRIAGAFADNFYPDTILMIGIDHSQTGGIIRRLSERYGSDQVSLIVLDAHTDMFDSDILFAAQKQILGLSGADFGSPAVPYNSKFYGCGNFLKYLLDEGTLCPENLFLIGVTDCPAKGVKRTTVSENEHIERYVCAYRSILERGVNVVPKIEVESSMDGLFEALEKISTPYVYISIDMDIGSCASTYAVRFPSMEGIEERLIYDIARAIRRVKKQKNIRCLGLDVMEIDVHYAGHYVRGRKDRAYDIASNLIRIMLHEGEPLR